MEENLMPLLDEAMTECVFMDKIKAPDGEGGTINKWVDGIKFKCAISFDSSIEARIGKKSGVSSVYTITAPKGTALDYHDVIKRLEDEKIFRITSDGDDKMTPKSASFQVVQVTAEEWTL